MSNHEQEQDNAVEVNPADFMVTIGSLEVTRENKELYKALAQFTQQMVQPEKKGKNLQRGSTYVLIDAIVKSVAEGMKGTGLGYVQSPIIRDDFVGIETLITHESGQSMKFPPFGFKSGSLAPQQVGAFMTYARRYSLSAAFGIASDSDDDGNQAEETLKDQALAKANQPTPIDRPELLSNINGYLLEIHEVTGKPVGEVRKLMLESMKIDAFDSLQGVALKTGEMTVRRALEKAKANALAEKAIAQKEAKARNEARRKAEQEATPEEVPAVPGPTSQPVTIPEKSPRVEDKQAKRGAAAKPKTAKEQKDLPFDYEPDQVQVNPDEYHNLFDVD